MVYEHAYALYKLGKEKQALDLIESITSEDRGLRVLEAQMVGHNSS
jgi:hypothetical protein